MPLLTMAESWSEAGKLSPTDAVSWSLGANGRNHEIPPP